MPAKFDACVKGGGMVRTKTLSSTRYIKICKPHTSVSGAKWIAGEVHTTTKKKESGSSKTK